MDRARRVRDPLRRGAAALVAAALAAPAAGAELPAPQLVVFRLDEGRLIAPPGAPSGALPIGSLAKPFVARAWARAHPGSLPPVVRCSPASHCWNSSGHGTLGLVRATSVSCNTYFLALAGDTPAPTLAAALRGAGLQPPDPLTKEAAIGLPSAAGLVSAAPEALLRAYVALLREPWEGAEGVRQELLAGLREAAREGTAAGLAQAGYHAKTGTVPALDGRALATSGWALAVDASGRGLLALLTPGTGREAARALARRLRDGGRDDAAPAAGARRRDTDRVRVALFGALAPRRVLARNAGAAPVAASRGYVGAGGSLDLRPGDRLEEGDWELSVPAFGLRRLLRGALRVDAGPGDVLRLRAELMPVEYVAGVIAAELPPGDDRRLVPLGAAVLRFLAEGPRHGDADVCDLTHCAWFVGRGPRAAWPVPARAGILERPGERAPAGPALGDEPWRRILALALADGPARWTSHCGGEPLSPHRVWGGADTRVFRCDRHGPAERAPWTRRWASADVERAFGSRVSALRVGESAGRWELMAQTANGALRLSWDEAHARLASVLGWGALPSPADRVERDGAGFRAEGRGLGHRVGLCLGAAAGPLLD